MTTRLQDDSGRVPPASVTHAEAKLGLEARIIPNHEREYPDVMSMALPQFVEPTLREFLSRVSGKRVGLGGVSEGELVGSVEIPCIEEVVVDVWRTDGWTWATTTVSDVKVSYDTDTTHSRTGTLQPSMPTSITLTLTLTLTLTRTLTPTLTPTCASWRHVLFPAPSSLC